MPLRQTIVAVVTPPRFTHAAHAEDTAAGYAVIESAEHTRIEATVCAAGQGCAATLHALDRPDEIGRVIRTESAQRGVGREAGALSLIVDLEAGRLPHQLVRVDRRCPLDHRGLHPRRADRLIPAGPRCGHGDLAQPHDRSRQGIRMDGYRVTRLPGQRSRQQHAR